MMDADDLSVPDRFEKQMRYFEEHPEVSAAGGWITEFVSAEDPTDTSRRAGSRRVPETDAEIREYIRNQLEEDLASDQISLKEFVDPFTGEKNK